MNLYQKKGEYDEMEYISREALLEQLKAMESYNASPMYRRGYDDCVEAILKTPAADVVPVVHGRWDDSGRYTFPSGNVAVMCTNCGCALTESEYHLNNWNYCPVCGAKMDGGEDNG